MEWYEETLHDDFRLRLRVDRVLHRETTEHQELMVFDSPCCGRVLGLDGVIQTTQADEHIYHEMMVHPALFAHRAARDVLIIGGGDGGCAREALKHPRVRLTMVEIDPRVVDLCRRFLPDHSAGAFDDPRLRLVIGDAARFVADTDERFDAILVDSTDPIGPGEALFQEPFYGHCRRCLRPGGVLVAQNGVPFLQSKTMVRSHRILSDLFPDATVFLATVPTYAGGVMAFSWASDDPGLRDMSPAGESFPTRFYDRDVHRAAFALPRDLATLLMSRPSMKENPS